MSRQTWAIATMAALVSSQVFAIDIITRKSDPKRLSGAISEMSKTEVKIKKQAGEPDVVAANDVQAIEYEGGGPDLRLGYSDENNGNYAKALEKYNKAKNDAKNPSEYLKGEFDYVIARANALDAMTDSSKQDAAVKGLLAVQKSRPDHFRYYESVDLLGRLYLTMGNFAEARTTYDQLAKAPWNETKMLSKIAFGRVFVAESKFDEAAKEFEAAAAMAADNNTAEQGRKYQAMLGQARALISQSKFDDAIKILELVTDKGPPENWTVQGEAWVLLGNALQAMNRPKEAALAYLRLEVLPEFGNEKALHAEALYNLAKTWKQVQSEDRSVAAAAKLAREYPNSPWRKKLESGQ